MWRLGNVPAQHCLGLALPVMALASCTGAKTPAMPEAGRPVATFTEAATGGQRPTDDATQIAAAWQRAGTLEASAAGTAHAAVSTPVVAGRWVSPDGRGEVWLEAWTCPPDDALSVTATADAGEWPTACGLERLMARLDGGTPTVVYSQLYRCEGLGAYGLDGRFWPPDGRVFYFTEAAHGVPDGLPCGCCPGLKAWSVDSGEISGEYVPSPDRKRVARLRDGKLEVGEANLVAMGSYSPPVGTRPGGYPVWSPDGEWLALPDWPNGCGQAPSGALALRVADGHWLSQPAPGSMAQIIDLHWSANSRTLILSSLTEPGWTWDVVSNSVQPLATP